jgi:AcrR family transcriptional regulator
MADDILTPERILEVAEEILRRYGPAKATVIDVARALGVSHGSVYRHFPSKAALREAVTERWLTEVSSPLEKVVAEDGPALARLRRWFELLIASKRRRAFDDPEMFATYMAVAAEANNVVKAHVRHLADQISRIIADGVAQGVFTVADPVIAGWAVYNATIRFYDPAHAQEWSDSDIDTAFEGVWSLILSGLGVRKTSI